jgi:putative membrane protein
MDVDDKAVMSIERPVKALWNYYLLRCCLVPPLFPVLALLAWFHYHTMRYKFTDEGISMSWGILFRRQIILNYTRIQDIHLRSNIVERWLGLACIQVQTASGTASAEMTIVGLKNFEEVRDFLYSRMRGVKQALGTCPALPISLPVAQTIDGNSDAALAAELREIGLELHGIRVLLEKPKRNDGQGERHV